MPEQLFFIAKIIFITVSLALSVLVWALLISCILFTKSKRHNLDNSLEELHGKILKKGQESKISKLAKEYLFKPDMIINTLLMIIPLIPFSLSNKLVQGIGSNILLNGIFDLYGNPKLLKNIRV